VDTVTDLGVPKNVGKFLGSCTSADHSRRTQLHVIRLSIAIRMLLACMP
jgi:hypothetical protein